MEDIVKSYLDVEQQIKSINSQLKDLRKTKQEISETLISTMQSNNCSYVSVPTNNCCICLNNLVQYSTIKKNKNDFALQSKLSFHAKTQNFSWGRKRPQVNLQKQ